MTNSTKRSMPARFLKPNIAGVLLYISVVVIGLHFVPPPTITYSFTDLSPSYSWSWLIPAVVMVLALYPICIYLGTLRPQGSVARMLTGPLMIIPQGIVVTVAVGVYIYSPPEIHGHLERHLFLQGNTDWGGGCLFAGTIALYVIFGFTASWHLALALADWDGRGFFKALIRSAWILKFHIIAFVLGGMAHIAYYDARVTPNDFRNMFLLAGLIYFLSVILICAMHVARMDLRIKLALAPMCVVLWLIVGSDGNTQRAGQLVQSGQDPQPVVRSLRHGIMLQWHAFCDKRLGDVSR